jgi:hypothetical protein
VLRFGPVLLTVASIPFLMWSQRGLETPVVAMIVLWLALCCIDPARRHWWPVAGALLVFTRPEGPLFLLALLPVFAFDRERRSEAVRGVIALSVALFVLLSARFLYFHDFVPTPFYVRLQTDSGAGLAQIRKYIVHNHVWLVGVPLFLVAWRRSFWTRERVVLGVLVLIACVWCVIANDYMPYARNLVPAIPLVFVLVFAAADSIQRQAGLPRGALVAYLAVAFSVTLFLSRSMGEFTSTTGNAVRRYVSAFAGQPRAYIEATAAKIRSPMGVAALDLMLERYGTIDSTFQTLVGDFFKRNYPPEAVVVYDQMGQTPFHAGASMRFIDSLGLTDRTVGRFYFESHKHPASILALYDRVASAAVRVVFGEERRSMSASEVLDYLFGQNPDVILVNTAVASLDPMGIPARLSGDARLGQQYELRYRLAGFLMLYERRNATRTRPLDVPFGLGVVVVKRAG